MRSRNMLQVLCCASTLAAASAALGQNVVRNDVAVGLSINNTTENLQLVRGYPSGARVAHDFNLAFVNSVNFDHTDGFRHAAFGNLIVGNVGVGGLGNPGALINVQTQGGSPGASQQFYTSSTDAPLPTRVQTFAISPNNQRIVTVGGQPAAAGSTGQLTMMTYNGGPARGTGAGASFSNVQQLAGPITGNTLSGVEWLDNSSFITISHPTAAGLNAALQRVTVAADNTMTATPVGTPFTFPVAGTSSGSTSFAYEPTISPYVYLSIGQFFNNTATSQLLVFDPNNNFVQVGSFDYSTSSNTFRDISFTANGDLIIATAGGSLETIAGANVLSNLANNNSTDYYTGSGQTSNFGGADTAMTNVDYKTPGVTVNMRQRKAVVRYFPGTVNDPTAEIRGRLLTGRNGGAWNGTGSAIISTDAAGASPANKGIGYAQASELGLIGGDFFGTPVTGPAILMRYTYYGDTDLNGIVNFDDYSRTDAGFNSGTGDTWFEGDFDYNGSVNFDDYSLIDNAFNTQSGTLGRAAAFLDGSDPNRGTMNTPALTKVLEHFDQFGAPYANAFLNSVPEPTSALALAIGGLVAGARRRRK